MTLTTRLANFRAPHFTAVIAQLVRAQDCESWGRGFESRWPPHCFGKPSSAFADWAFCCAICTYNSGFMGRSTDFCAVSGQFRLQVKIPQNSFENTGGLTLLFVIQHADAIAALSATPASRRQLRPRFSEIYRCHMFEARGNPKSPLIRSNQAALNTAPYLSLPVDAISMRGGKPSSRNDLPHFPQGRRRRNLSLSISGTP